MSHHTKDKGDLGVAKSFADLVGQGMTVLFPATEHAPFDLVAYAAGAFVRVQVKYRSAANGTFTVHFRSVWADRNGTHVRPLDKTEVDVICVYCPQTDECYYLRPSDFGKSVTLRVSPPRSAQRARVLSAASFRSIPL